MATRAERQRLADLAALGETPPPRRTTGGRSQPGADGEAQAARQQEPYRTGTIVSGPQGVTVIHPHLVLDDVDPQVLAEVNAASYAPASPAMLPIRDMGSGLTSASVEYHARQLRGISPEDEARLAAELAAEEASLVKGYSSGVIRASVAGHTIREPMFTPDQLSQFEAEPEPEYHSATIRARRKGYTTAGAEETSSV
ncbi:uncharacterized protein AMSG_00694 [Thecamonas trahens ATCC 50062]|uniref:Uncharacterized protein n=1 Tax=Thecamonas trahens ATCC 50062 TaxID=461836 RepID=A0A0L0DDX2_THETB|nr:hypothetical protein AMSG_00694 [Thecamonas trahens ATCC 50062]KNC50532.1 hypothetical protein AMSG_00694 [Thecamonas trahens ATCC 50062]|eukprot:XP_013762424.1 hypothetical protein AMSG_00694 [Thecamonas trahens ATCC 50062]